MQNAPDNLIKVVGSVLHFQVLVKSVYILDKRQF